MAGYLLSIDAGTGSIRALLVEVETGKTATACRKWRPRPSPEGVWAYDFDTESAWAFIVEVVREALQKANALPSEVLGIAATSMRHTLVLVRDGKTVFAVPNMDARAAAESMEIAAERGEAIYLQTGRWPSPIFMLPRLRWLLSYHPEFLKGATAFTLGDWIAYRLCGEKATDFSHAGESMLLDIHKREWIEGLVTELGLPLSLLPPITPSGTLLGRLTQPAAEALGLIPGIPVAVGGADTQCALLALGILRRGEVAIVSGTTAPLQGVAEQPVLEPESRLWTGLHTFPERWVVESGAGPIGEALEWFAKLLFPDSPQPIARFMAEAKQAQPGSGGTISAFGVQIFNAKAMAFPAGAITTSHFLREAPRPALCRAILEGMAFAIRANLEQIAQILGHPPRIAMTGGMTRSPFWAQLVASALEQPIEISLTPEGTALGAAICAGVAAGIFKGLEEGVERLARVQLVQPDEAALEIYKNLYLEWREFFTKQGEAQSLASNLILQNIIQPAPPKPFAPIPFRPKILVTAQMDEESLAKLSQLGDVEYSCYRETLRVLTGDDLIEALKGVHIFITEVDVVDLDALRQLPDLRVVVSCRGRAVNVDVEACTAMGIPVLYAPGRNADAVADLTIAFMLALLRKLIPADHFLREPGGEAGDMARMGRAFEAFLGRELWGKTVGLIGFGAVGRQVARRLIPFGVRLLVYDPYISPDEAALYDAELVTLEKLLAESDIVSLHAPVTDETRGMIGREALLRMKRGALLINTARAALVDEEALAEALRSGHLAGAAVDVFSVEPPASDHPLLALPNVIATPHIGGNTEEVASHQGKIVVEDLRRFLAGERPQHILNPEVLQSFSWTGPRRELGEEELEKLAKRPAPAVSDLQQEQKAPVVKEERMVKPTEDPRAEMVQAINELYQLGLITATGGNVSVRIEGREECWITPSQIYKGALKPELMVRIDFQGKVLEEGSPAPSSEWPMHTAIYRARPDVGAIVHAHAPYATILALAGLPFLPITTEAAFLGEIPVVRFIMPGTKELADAVVEALGQKNTACLLQNHGVVVAAADLRRACNIVEVVERTAQLIWGCYALGKKPKTLPKETLKTLRKIREMKG